MTIQEITRKANKLVADYLNKYGLEPNAIKINEEELTTLLVFNKLYTKNMQFPTFDEAIHTLRFMGMAIIPVKKGEMEVFELL